MQIAEIHKLREVLGIPAGDFVETHISWVLLDAADVYKIKKPVRFSFLDFSTLAQRLDCCMREVALNNRLTEDMYLGVVAVTQNDAGIGLDETGGEIIDYAVHMRRQPGDRQMDIMLRKGQVTVHHMEQIAAVLSDFHRHAIVPRQKPDPNLMLQDFSDLVNSTETIRTLLGPDAVATILRAVETVDHFLHQHAGRISERYTLGFYIDGHGDLHSKNIFLQDKPVIYDCIEFNDHFRYVDVLDEIAFFCLDLALYHQEKLATRFLDVYLSLYPCLLTEQDRGLFHYFQLYRAGVKLKINILKITGQGSGSIVGKERVRGYFRLFEAYLDVLTRDH